MKAVGLYEQGGPDVLQIVDLPQVEAEPGQVRIRVSAAAVNPTDLLARNGSRLASQKTEARPLVPGMDLAGIVDQVGESVFGDIKIGDKVIAVVAPEGSYGAYREQIVVDARSVALAPMNTSLTEASTLGMNGLTVMMSLDLLALEPGQVLAVTGAAGAYGGVLIQLAKHRGLTVIADAADKDVERVKRSGADIVVRRGNDVAERILEHFPDGVDGLADGAVLNELVIPAVKDGGSFTSVRLYGGNGERGIHFTKTFVADYRFKTEKLRELSRLVEQGVLTLDVAAVYPPEEAAESHRRLEQGGVRGRLVLDFE